MAWTITERFPSWGESGEFPAAGFFYEGGDQVNEKHLDALWNGINGLEEDVQSALNDIDSDSDGVVDKANNLAAGAVLDGDLVATDGEVIWDESSTHIPQGRLQNDSVTINASSPLSGGGGVALGNSVSIDVDTSTLAGGGLTGSGNQVDHADTSSQGNVSAPNGGAINALNFDGYGHVTGASTVDFDSRFVNESDTDQFANLAMRFKDQAIDFDGGNGETVTFNGTTNQNGYIKLLDAQSNNYDAGGWDTSDIGEGSPDQGVKITINTGLVNSISFNSVDYSTHASADVPNTVYLKDVNGNNLDSVDTSGQSGRVSGTFNYDASDGEVLYIVRTDSAYYEMESNDSLPRSFDLFDFDGGFLSTQHSYGGGVNSNTYHFREVTADSTAATSGSAVIEWGDPKDIYSWELAVWQRRQDGETVTFDVEDQSGNTLKSNISRVQNIEDISAGTNVRIRANLSRSSTSNQPKADYVGRQYRR